MSHGVAADHWTVTATNDLPAPDAGQCLVVRFPLDADATAVEHLRQVLSSDEVERAERFIRPAHGRAFTVGRGMLRTILGAITNHPPDSLQFDYGKHGKPALTRGNVEFNVSHSGGQAIIAISSQRPVGIDLESRRANSDLDKIARRYFAPEEVEAIEQLAEPSREAAFYRCWCSKEALMKVTGQGLSLGLNSFVVNVNPHHAPGLIKPPEHYPECSNYWWAEIPLERHPAAILVLGVNHLGSDTISINMVDIDPNEVAP